MSTVGAPSLVNRIRSRQAGHPTGLLGRIIGRVMVKDTASANDRAVELLALTEPCTVPKPPPDSITWAPGASTM